MINSNFSFNDPQLSKLLYLVIANSLPDDHVLSKDASLDFLKDLFYEIDGTDEEFDAYIKTGVI
jgi:hypothetical protein